MNLFRRKPKLGLGYRKDVVLSTDVRYAAARPLAGLRSVDYREHVPEVLHQGATSSCVGHAFAAAIAVTESLAGLPYVPVSARAIYYNARTLHGGEHSDSGTFLRSAAEAMRRVGAGTALTCPMDPKRINEHPPAASYMEGHSHRDCRFERLMEVDDRLLDQIWAALCAGQPVVIGVDVTQRYMDAGPGERRVIAEPMLREPILGGHALCVMGRDADGFITQGSYGPGHGENGFTWLEDEYLAGPHCHEVIVVRDWNAVRPGRAA